MEFRPDTGDPPTKDPFKLLKSIVTKKTNQEDDLKRMIDAELEKHNIKLKDWEKPIGQASKEGGKKLGFFEFQPYEHFSEFCRKIRGLDGNGVYTHFNKGYFKIVEEIAAKETYVKE